MPIYIYKCKNCGKTMEKFKPMNSNGYEVCDNCGSEAVRVFSPAGIIFKGSGFYSTDYKSKSNVNKTKDENKSDEKKPSKENKKEQDNKNKTTGLKKQ